MTEREPFRMQIKVRLYELDPLGHLNHAVYHSYAEVARIEAFDQASGGSTALREAHVAPVLLASQINYRREIVLGETVEVTARAKFGTGKSFQMEQNIVKADGVLAADLALTLGLMHLERRKLVEDPRGWFERAGYDISLLTGE
ncbi:acyl-CoA thioesterase [Amycolatopsis sp. K13G38]|uniref:Acyl-CoA thioesterase n=1 Tax=Amycolatopsis acididurans TaxID=2724524 RepID=A0ABX1JI85_9PSEU|nr:acyl-CoA thioesterase [Amycolatopsis acididurans]NKQ59318.1 acyl-CoA thioesterase [Amycolatopsis acididurans]